ncbi:MAG: hypothetical protein L6R40_008692 [Gallowayella cf. fulva]|nr:MAG: hypothetical protein L6R40_008692 [Xanthomendoza cf. fulva]
MSTTRTSHKMKVLPPPGTAQKSNTPGKKQSSHKAKQQRSSVVEEEEDEDNIRHSPGTADNTSELNAMKNLLGTAILNMSVPNTAWTAGKLKHVRNRGLNQGHILRLVDSFKHKQLARTEVVNRIRVCCSQDTWEVVKAATIVDPPAHIQDYNQGRFGYPMTSAIFERESRKHEGQSLKTDWIYVHWPETLPRPELLNGQHRAYALLTLFNEQVARGTFKISDWDHYGVWVVDFFNESSMSQDDLNWARANTEQIALGSSDGDLWPLVMDTIESKTPQEQHRITNNLSVKEMYGFLADCTVYKYQRVWKSCLQYPARDLITQMCLSGYGRNQMSISTWGKAFTLRLDKVWEMRFIEPFNHFLEDWVTAARMEHISSNDMAHLALVPPVRLAGLARAKPRSIKRLLDLFFPNPLLPGAEPPASINCDSNAAAEPLLEHHSVSAGFTATHRRSNFLDFLSDSEYLAAYQVLTRTRLAHNKGLADVPIPTIHDLEYAVNGPGLLVSQILPHILRWLDSLFVTTTNNRNPSRKSWAHLIADEYITQEMISHYSQEHQGDDISAMTVAERFVSELYDYVFKNFAQFNVHTIKAQWRQSVDQCAPHTYTSRFSNQYTWQIINIVKHYFGASLTWEPMIEFNEDPTPQEIEPHVTFGSTVSLWAVDKDPEMSKSSVFHGEKSLWRKWLITQMDIAGAKAMYFANYTILTKRTSVGASIKLSKDTKDMMRTSNNDLARFLKSHGITVPADADGSVAHLLQEATGNAISIELSNPTRDSPPLERSDEVEPPAKRSKRQVVPDEPTDLENSSEQNKWSHRKKAPKDHRRVPTTPRQPQLGILQPKQKEVLRRRDRDPSAVRNIVLDSTSDGESRCESIEGADELSDHMDRGAVPQDRPRPRGHNGQ